MDILCAVDGRLLVFLLYKTLYLVLLRLCQYLSVEG